ncbi:cytochrome b [Parvibaculum sp.]|uniref:cytochrome b n=1 Tax=Parvibaculum sp. TaxID=2024848 RepID=UPI000C912236|nr:cytochrome b [Parvibaculum sp.]MAB14265.1 cytochrome B [Parvibaculum sp.]
MQLSNSQDRYGILSITLHWLVAILFLAMLAIGLVMTRLPLTDPLTFPLYQLHKSIGATLFLLMAVRLVLRLAVGVPDLPAGLTPFERFAARATHAGLYAILLAMPLTGWVVVSASPFGIATLLYGVVPLPHIGFIEASPDKAAIENVASWVHTVLAALGTGLLLLHVAAALWHHFMRRDEVLMRMLGRSRRSPTETDRETNS